MIGQGGVWAYGVHHSQLWGGLAEAARHSDQL